jgi:hypothetical protein
MSLPSFTLTVCGSEYEIRPHLIHVNYLAWNESSCQEHNEELILFFTNLPFNSAHLFETIVEKSVFDKINNIEKELPYQEGDERHGKSLSFLLQSEINDYVEAQKLIEELQDDFWKYEDSNN